MKRCLNCGKEELNNNATQCSACGGVLEKCDVMFCPKCGDRISGNMAFCPKCGASLSGDDNLYNEAPVAPIPDANIPPVYETVYPETPPKKKTGLIVLISLVAVLIVAVVVGAVIILGNQGAGSDTDSDKSDDTETVESEKSEEQKTPEKPEEDKETPDDTEGNEEAEVDTSEAEREVRQTMSSFSDLFLWGDDNALRYVKEGSQAYSEIEDTLELFATIPEAMEEDFSADIGISESSRDEVQAVLSDFVKGYVELSEIEIESVSVSGDTAAVTTKMSIIDPNSFENMNGEALAVEAANNIFTREEIANLQYLSGEARDEAMLKLVKEMFRLMLEDIEENKEMETESVIFYLEETDGQWLIYKTVGLNS